MADSITPILGLTKPEVGASDDTWGDKSNTNLGLLDTFAGTTVRVLDSGVVASAQATLDLPLPTDVDLVKIVVTGLLPITDLQDLYVRVSTNSGSSYLSSGTDYAYAMSYLSPTSVTATVDCDDQAAFIRAAITQSASTSASSNLELTVSYEAGRFPQLSISNVHGGSVIGLFRRYEGAAVVPGTASKLTNIRLVYASGNISACRWCILSVPGL